ncbi:response regulator [Pedobacter sp. L105]|uniref:response regulator n=1 Tax=Pedobacter sp. L105 TaxID=1641871 RepID=UPI00131E2776|nr:response regulator [Pedobacter sp. L105]
MAIEIERPLRVMLIDDNIIDLKINNKIILISKLFDDIIQFQSGEDALNYFSDHANEPDKMPHLILLDIQMPEMDGFEFLENYKRFSPQLKDSCLVAMLSSTLDFGDIHKAEANPYVIKLLKKPLIPSELEIIFNANFKIID